MAAFDVKKFVSGFNILDGEKRGKLLFYAILLIIFGFIMWSAFIKPTKHDLQNVSQRMDFHGARIDSLHLTTEKNSREDSSWLVGPVILYNEEDGWTFGGTLLKKF